MDDQILEAVRALRAARHITVLTGAGISAESGIPTFRDALTGLWSKYNPTDLATPEAFARHPARVTQWYDERRSQVARCRPNAGHEALRRLQEFAVGRGVGYSLITQNVDRLHQAAGTADVIELHGTLWVWRCVDCGQAREELGGALSSYPPRCECGGLRRPGVVWFGEELAVETVQLAKQATAACDFFISIGTSSVVYPAAGFIEQALSRGVDSLEVNPEVTPFGEHFRWSIRGRGGEALGRLVERVVNSQGEDVA